MMKYIYHAEAFDEYQQAVLYYKEISQDLAERFFINAEQAISLIREQPSAWTPVSSNVRRAFVKNFPYSIFFSEHEQTIFILAVAHQKRKPRYWKKRSRK